MKKFTLIVMLLAATALFAPLILGMQAQSALEEGMDNAAAQTGGYLHAELEDFERGWFSSTGKIRVGFSEEYLTSNPAFQQAMPDGTPAREMLLNGFVQDIEVSHGPLTDEGLGLGRLVSTIDANSHPDLAEFLSKTGNDYLMRAAVNLGFSGAGDISMDAPAFQVNNLDNGLGEMVFAGASAIGNVDFSDLHWQVEGQVNGFSLVSPQGEAVLERTTFRSDMAYPEHAPYGLGEGEVKVSRIVALSGDQTNFDMRQANITFATTQNKPVTTDQARVAVQVSYAVETLVASGTELKDMRVTFGMQDLDGAALTELQALSRNMPTDPNDIPQMIAQFDKPLYDLLAGGAVITLNPASFIYNNQPFNANIELRSKPDSLPSRDAFSLQDPMLIASLFKIKADLAIDQRLATELAIPQIKQQLLAGVPPDTEVDDAQLEQMARAQVPMMMGALVGQGMLLEDGGNYTLSAQYDNGALLVNGNPIPLGAILQSE